MSGFSVATSGPLEPRRMFRGREMDAGSVAWPYSVSTDPSASLRVCGADGWRTGEIPVVFMSDVQNCGLNKALALKVAPVCFTLWVVIAVDGIDLRWSDLAEQISVQVRAAQMPPRSLGDAGSSSDNRVASRESNSRRGSEPDDDVHKTRFQTWAVVLERPAKC